ncbi:hypothetical protein DID88_001236 [Monilinia fructigena]|uniref:Uncharacterized protein n=1 Tax=Monilinia fructigena TaxID=38457 RepID=A0A395IXW6_9HELO|nr:hypothetical protein DID88_001236 [Monilinia fructigena]
MTTLLKAQYENKPLYVIPTQVLTVKNHSPLMAHLRQTHPEKEHLIEFDAFAALSNKSQNLTLKDIFLKMLMRTKGISALKAIEIQKRWPTPVAFLEAYEQLSKRTTHDDDDSRAVPKPKGKGVAVILDPEELLAKRKRELVSGELGALVGNGKVQGALSAKLAEVWGGVL